jgi:hypothetical protein
VVQSEFLFQVKAFIPYAWTEAELILGVDLLHGLVAKGDKRGFINAYSNDANKFNDAPFRVCQTVVITPYEELHSTSDIEGERHLWTAPVSEHFDKTISVDPAEMARHYGYIDLTGARSKFGKPPSSREHYWFPQRNTSHTAQVTIEGAGVDGALPVTGGAADIHWYLGLKVWADTDPLAPLVQFSGQHDRYPAYEIIVIQSNGTYKDIHRVLPNAGDLPGPFSLDDGNARTVDRTDQITQ